jgi:hypothetical protein
VQRLRRGPRKLDGGIVPEDRPMQLLQGGSRLEAELVPERDTRRPELLERLGLPPGAVEREHQQLAQPLAQGMLATSVSSSATTSACRPRSRSARAPLLDRLGRELREPARFGTRPAAELAPLERVAAPTTRAPRAARPPDEKLEALGVQLPEADVNEVPLGRVSARSRAASCGAASTYTCTAAPPSRAASPSTELPRAPGRRRCGSRVTAARRGAAAASDRRAPAGDSSSSASMGPRTRYSI